MSEFDQQVEEWLDKNWERIVSDIDSLVRIESVEDPGSACSCAPFGSGPRAALTRALEIADGMGLETCDVDGYVGFADMVGASETQVGIIGHVDVVPAGPGWSFDPFAVTRKDGYLVGRGVIDDKGPIMCALHAMRFWKERGEMLPATVRIIFGANEENGMGDVPYYRERYEDPTFLFTPDAEFPVCYGEKGMWGAKISSAPLGETSLVSLWGGTVANAVPGVAGAIVRLGQDRDPMALSQPEGITVSPVGDDQARELGCVGDTLVRIDATGKSAHASTPELGVNANGILCHYLLDEHLVGEIETTFFQFAIALIDDWHATGWGIDCEDDDFGALTAVGSVIAIEEGRLTLLVDSRFPTTTDVATLERTVREKASEHAIELSVISEVEPFLAGHDAPEVKALIDVYNEVTGEDAKPFTMGGGTYARKFSRAVSFGVEKPWEDTPAWAGGMHGPDEAVSEALLRQATKIYIYAIERLCAIVAR